MMFRKQFGVTLLATITALALAGCGDDGVSSAEEAARAYNGLDTSIDQAIQLGFDGFNAASNATIPAQTGKGLTTGTMTISGKVDQGASDNKTMTLNEALKAYSNDGKLTYDTNDASLPVIDMKLSKIPTGTIEGTLKGTYTITGELEGTVTLNLVFTGGLQPLASDATKIERKPGTTHITGTADSDYGTYNVDITR